MANIQNFRADFPIADPETGLITPEFLRFLFDKDNGIVEIDGTATDAQTTAEAAQADVEALEDNAVVAGVGLDGGGVLSDPSITLDLADTSVTPGSYTNTNLTVDQQGRITAAANGTATGGTVTSISFTAPTGFSISGSPITSSGTLSLTFAAGYSLPTNSSQAEWDTAYSWGDHSVEGYLTLSDLPEVSNEHPVPLVDGSSPPVLMHASNGSLIFEMREFS